MILGGPEVGAATLTNFYGLHIAFIPLSIFAIVSFHIWRVRKDTLTIPRAVGEEKPKKAEKVTTIPYLVSIELVFALVMLALLVGWSVFVNAPLEEAANPAHSPNPAKAPWFLLWVQELVSYAAWLGAVVPLLLLALLIAAPYAERETTRAGTWLARDRRGRCSAFIAVASLVFVLLIIAAFFRGPGWAFTL